MLETIKHEAKGDLVKVAQYLTGFANRNEASGIYDANFVAHVCAWQSSKGITSDGVIGPATWTKIASSVPTCSTSKNKTSAYTCALQILIGGLDVDGIYGTRTKQAVAAYQAANNLSVDGICGPKTWAGIVGTKSSSGNNAQTDTNAGVVIENGKVLNNCVHYLQWDKRWKNIKYSTHTSEQTIGNSGCGPTAMAMILATFIDKSITPVEICKMSVDNGYRTENSGTSWGLFPYIYDHYSGFSQYVPTKSIETLKAALKQGALAVCSMNSNDNCFWTKGGHFITAIGYDSDGYIYANDPNKSSAPRKQEQSKFQSCMKKAFIFWPATEPKVDDEPVSTPNANAPVGTQIVDISKWQGNIDFEALAKEVSFVIARAGVGSDPDPRFDEYAQSMKANSIPFGVYCYSYAGDAAKAKDEAMKLVQRTAKYTPLFWVMDAEEAKITTESIRAFAEELRAQGAERIGCYVAHHRYKAYNYDSLRSLWNFTWIPCYGSNNGTIEGSKEPSYVCDLWQYTSTGHIAGISGNADMNIITGKGKTLEWFLDGGNSSAENPQGETTAYKSVMISDGNCNVRTQPNTNGEIVGVAFNGETLPFGGEIASNGWLSVMFNGKKCYVSNKYGKLV